MRWILAILLLGCAASNRETAPPIEPSAFGRLSDALPGVWHAGHGLAVEYRVVSRGSVVLETWMPGTPAETITAYHLDYDHVMLTHYCAQGNQPRLRLVEATRGRFTFARFDATNVAPDAAVLTELTLALDGSTLTRTDTYALGKERESTTIVFARAR